MPQEKKLGCGQQFGQWTLVGDEPLGRGGNGAVWKAASSTGQLVAIKFLHKNHFATERWQRFKDEVQFLLQEKGREGILPMVDHYLPENPTIENRPWFCTELATPFTSMRLAGAGNLLELVRRMEYVARSLGGLHNEGKSHRDIKPENLFDLGGKCVLGDWGLVDFPEKAAITESGEIMGPLFYVAPEMMSNAANIPGQPADVYSLAKTLWVLASGQHYPLPGHQPVEDRASRLSTYCPHPRAHHLDALIERCTATTSSDRPTMPMVADELAAWLKEPQTGNVTLDIESLTKEYGLVFDAGNRATRHRSELEQNTAGVLTVFRSTFNQIAMTLAAVTRIPPSEGAIYDIPESLGSIETMDSPQVWWRGAYGVEVEQGDPHHVRLTAFVQAELLSDENARLVYGYLLRYEFGDAHELIAMNMIGTYQATIPIPSAQLDNELSEAHTKLLGSLAEAIQRFAEQVKAVQA